MDLGVTLRGRKINAFDLTGSSRFGDAAVISLAVSVKTFEVIFENPNSARL